MDAVSETRAGLLISVRVKPGSRRATVDLHGGVVHVAVSAPAEKGKANDAVLKALGRALGIAPSLLAVHSGTGARDKRVLVRGIDADTLRARVAQLGS